MNPLRQTLLTTLSLGLIGVASMSARGQDEAPAREMTDVSITVEEAGESPRAALRYEPEVGDEHRIKIELSSQMTQMGQTQKIPTMAISLTMMFDEVDDGSIKGRVRVDHADVSDDAGVQPMLAMQVKAGLQAATGKVATLLTSDRGLTERFEFTEADKAEPMLRNTLESIENVLGTLLAPLPEEKVGVGARWVASTSISRSGLTIDQSITYALKSLESKGMGTATVALDELAPSKGSMSTQVTSNLSFNQGGMPQQFTQTATSKSEVSRPE